MYFFLTIPADSSFCLCFSLSFFSFLGARSGRGGDRAETDVGGVGGGDVPTNATFNRCKSAGQSLPRASYVGLQILILVTSSS